MIKSKTLVCNRDQFFVNFTANVSLHVLLLFTVLSLLFIKIISKIESKTINSELTDIISDTIKNNYEKLDPEQQKLLSASIKHIDFKNIIELYSTEDTTRKLNNKDIFRSIYISIILLFTMLILILVISKKLCNNIPIKHMISENIIIFAVVCVIEYMFFKNIIMNYVPVKPSFMMQYMVNKVKSVL